MKQKTSTKDLSLRSNERLFFENGSMFAPKKYKNLYSEEKVANKILKEIK